MGLVRPGQALVGDVEGVRVLHHELAATQHPGSRPGFVPVLGLDLEEHQREVFVRAVLAFDQQREKLFVGGGQEVAGSAPVLQAEQVVPVVLPATALLEDLSRDKGREEDLLRSHCEHFFADDTFHVPHRQ